LWIVGTVLFVLAPGEIKAHFDAIAAMHLLELHRQHWHRRQTTSHDLKC
jgi:hypothetical protein